MIKIKSKEPKNVLGYKINCPDYNPCPLCYGCRSFDPSYYKCINLCGENIKYNICKTSKHRANLLAKMIKKTTINVNGDLLND